MDDKRVIVCNYKVATSAVAKGAKAYVSMYAGDALSIAVVARSRGGRWVWRWERSYKLENFRFKMLPASHPRYNDERIAYYYEDSDLDWFKRITAGAA